MRTPRSGGQNSPSVSSASSTIHQQPPRSSRRQQQPSHHLNHHQRYHFNNLDPGMPVNVWGIDRRDVWRTCFCFHVRTVTIFIGVWHLMLYILCLSFIAAMFLYEPRPDPMLPTPVSNTDKQLNEDIIYEIPRSDALTSDRSEHPRARLDAIRNGPFNFPMDPNKANSQVVLLTVCKILITLLMVYGAVQGKPSYLMPFFVLRVFYFCTFCMTMVGYFSYLPNVTEGIMNTHWLPFRDFFLNMDPQLLSLLTLVVIVGAIAVKAYIIRVIWNCCKYLMLRNSVIRTVIAHRHDGTDIMGLQHQNLLPDLPDYETAVRMGLQHQNLLPDLPDYETAVRMGLQHQNLLPDLPDYETAVRMGLQHQNLLPDLPDYETAVRMGLQHQNLLPDLPDYETAVRMGLQHQNLLPDLPDYETAVRMGLQHQNLLPDLPDYETAVRMGLQHQNLLPDLPDYETAVSDPRYAKKPPLDTASASASNNHGNPVLGAPNITVPPPPPYSVAIAAEPLNFNSPVHTTLENSTSQDHAQQTRVNF